MNIQPATMGIMGQQGAENPTGHDAFRDVDMQDFINLMIAELQHQDPLNPMDNTQMLQQISQIREIASSDRLSETLEAVLLGQNLNTASNMIGYTIVAMDDQGTTFTGTVKQVAIEEGVPKLRVLENVPEHVNPLTGETIQATTVEHTIELNNVSEILQSSDDAILLAEKLATANTLIGRSILGVTDEGKVIVGEVIRVAVEDLTPKLVLAEPVDAHTDENGELIEAHDIYHMVDLENLSRILSEKKETAILTGSEDDSEDNTETSGDD